MYILKNKFYRTFIFAFDLLGTVITLLWKLFKPKKPKHIKKILVIRLDHIGDLLAATPVFRIIKENYPNAKLDVLIAKYNKDIVRNNPFIDEIIAYDTPWFKRKNKRLIKPREFIKYVIALHKQHYDVGIDLRGDLRHIMLMWLAGIKYKIGYGITGGGFLLDKEVSFQQGVHEVQHNLDLLKAIGLEATRRKNEFFIPDEDKNFAEGLYTEKGLSNKDFVVCIHPSAGYLSKKWLGKKWSEVIFRLNKELNAKVIIVGAKGEKALCDNMKEISSVKVIDVVGKTKLGQLAALLKKANLFIGTDSGPSHIASAMSTPCVILYSGTNDPAQWAPLGKKIFIIQKDVPCKGCQKLKCANNICMDLITVDEVMKAVDKVLNKKT